ncbi:hypothetical protein TPENAI_61277 [Tenacibaculum litopenaei]|jgi:hypothetical protein|uniref:hypothetical protein n=1 Tax=Tenacibaculum litopenaei TaxID=396016 RepID=UPI003892FAD8
MIENISNLGTTLNKADQQTINGGEHPCGVFIRICQRGFELNEFCVCVPERGN